MKMGESKGNFFLEPEEIDEDYEFDAANFFDFTRVESASEIEDTERWFQFSGDYPDSPFVVKLDFEKLLSMETLSQTSKSMVSAKKNSISSASDCNYRNEVSYSRKNAKDKFVVQNNAEKTNIKPDDGLYQPRRLTFLKPTLSHLLKQQKVCDKHSNDLCTRVSRITSKLDKKGVCNLQTKRQKFEIGYLRKVAQLKHQFSLLHKSSKKATTSKEPQLGTSFRAQNRGADNVSASSEIGIKKQKGCSFSMHSFNKKTKEKANSHASAKVYPSARDGDSSEAGRQKECGLRKNYELSEGPPVTELSGLSLGSDIKRKNTCNSNRNTLEKESMKKVESSYEVELWRNKTKSNHCTNTRTKSGKCWPNITRSDYMMQQSGSA